ncbi:MAG TPA: YggS family pyridoxal phosphate-dependent enzyme, partial [Clostridiales bacterium]|nr:YggS family pyridoxal phosphate-dependent enzyme [Clostridiales bacterium]
KTVGTQEILKAVSAGLRLLGENRVQELLTKYDVLHDAGAQIHLIGHLQSNKVSKVIGRAAMIQSVDSIPIAVEIDKKSAQAGLVTDILIEVNIAGEASKSGFSPEQTMEAVAEISGLRALRIMGMMTVPPICGSSAEIRKHFAAMRRLFVDISGKKIDNVNCNILSMGMSGDYVDAILEGSTMVRIGSAIFGPRQYDK